MKKIHKKFRDDRDCILYKGDCANLLRKIPNEHVQLIISSPPYCMGKEYETSVSTDDFVRSHRELIPELYRILVPGGSLCWQVGYHAKDSSVTPLDYLAFQAFSQQPDLYLRNRIIWAFGHGLHGTKRFSGRHEVMLWFTKGKTYDFHLDRIRIPQKYPGKTHYKGNKRGKHSSNPKGKNPGDVWELPVVNASHVEKTTHPCQFPHALAQRLILALTNPGDVIMDPFFGSGTTPAAALIEGRRFVGSELCESYWKLAHRRVLSAIRGKLKYRPHDKPLMIPDPNSKVAKRPQI